MNRLLVLTAVCFSVSFAFAEVKVGYIDMQKAIQSTNAGKKAKKDLETEFNKRKSELEKKENDLKKMGEDLKRKQSVLSEEVFNRKQGEMQQEILQYREMVNKSQMDIQKKERDLTSPIVNKLKTVIDKVAKDEGYTVVLEKSDQSVIWAKSDLDITDKVVKEFEKQKDKK